MVTSWQSLHTLLQEQCGSRGVTGMAYEHKVTQVFEGGGNYAYHKGTVRNLSGLYKSLLPFGDWSG